MARRDLTEMELRELQRSLGETSGRLQDLARRLIGEVRELRDREASVRHMAGLEGEY
jgi:hypothetical protein